MSDAEPDVWDDEDSEEDDEEQITAQGRSIGERRPLCQTACVERAVLVVKSRVRVAVDQSPGWDVVWHVDKVVQGGVEGKVVVCDREMQWVVTTIGGVQRTILVPIWSGPRLLRHHVSTRAQSR